LLNVIEYYMGIVKLLIISVFVGLFLHPLSGQIKVSDDSDILIINNIEFEGNKVTRENILLREMDFTAGDTIYKIELIPRIQRSRENLLNLRLFNFVEIEVEHFPESRIDVIVNVTERWYIWPTPIFEHGERNLSEFLREPRWNRLNYGLWLKWNNFRGRNELLQTKIRLGYKEQYVLQYEKPNLGLSEDHKIMLSYSLSRQRRINYRLFANKPVFFQDEEEYSLSSGNAFFSYTYRPEIYSRHRFRLHYQNDVISDKVEALNPMFFGPGLKQLRYFRFDYVFRFDQRDSRVYPLEGNAFKVKLQRTGLELIRDFEYKNWELEGALFYHKEITNRVYFANAFKGKISTLKDAPYHFSNALGYSEFMTSYEYYVINGTDYFLNKFISKFEIVKPREFTIPYLKASQFNRVHYAIYLNLLADVGYVHQRVSDPSNFMANELQYSMGIGLDFVTYYDQVLRLEYSINRYGIAGFFVHVETPFFRW